MMLRTVRSRHFPWFLHLRKPMDDFKNPLLISNSTESSEFSFFCSLSRKPFTALAQIFRDSDEKIPKRREQLSDFFKRAVRPSERLQKSEFEAEAEHECENTVLIERSVNLEEEVRISKKKGSKNVRSFKLQTEKADPLTRNTRSNAPEQNKIDLPARSKADTAAGNGVKEKNKVDLPARSKADSTALNGVKAKNKVDLPVRSKADTAVGNGVKAKNKVDLPAQSKADLAALNEVKAKNKVDQPARSKADTAAGNGVQAKNKVDLPAQSKADSAALNGVKAKNKVDQPTRSKADTAAGNGVKAKNKVDLPAQSKVDSAALNGVKAKNKVDQPVRSKADMAAGNGVQAKNKVDLPAQSKVDSAALNGVKAKNKVDQPARSKADTTAVNGVKAKNKIDLPAPSKADSTARNEFKAMRSLSGLFSDIDEGGKSLDPTNFGLEDPMVHKELSLDMEMFAKHLYLKGYLKDANFITKNEFDSTYFENAHSREFLKFAAVKFGTNHQEIAKWLSASDLKRIALFGCPSLGHKTVHAAKKLRNFFEIQEHEVCQKCPLKESCILAYKSHRYGKELRLDVVNRLLSMYALGSVPKRLIVPEEITASVSRLLKEIINLSRTLS